jgi:choline dehydrogenase-like flavoprotein
MASPTMNQVLGFPRVPVHGKPTDGFPYEFLHFPAGDQPETLETDVVIVGSGCGGAVTAKNLAEAGLRVLVVEKSYSYSSKSFPMTPNEAYVNMFENAGATISEDGTMAVLAGSTWGGGGTVNWSAALQTQAYVRQEWADTGLPFFTSLEFQRSLDRVCDRMGVNTEHIVHNRQNNVILEGARKLGYAAKAVPQNTGNSEHYCGYCTLGCHSTGKKGPTESFLADAAKAGAIFIEGFKADKVTFDKKTNNGKRVAVGVEGTWTSRDSYLGLSGDGAVKRKLIIKAKKVVVSSGTLNSPLLLLRSGLKNSQIGKNLHLHPGKSPHSSFIFWCSSDTNGCEQSWVPAPYLTSQFALGKAEL